MNLVHPSKRVVRATESNGMHRKELLTLVASAILWISYISILISSYSKYTRLQSSSFLAMIEVLFPYFNVLTLSLAILCLACVIYDIENEYLQIELLVQFAIIYWVTPYYLAGYLNNADTLIHGGVSVYAPQVLSGIHTFFSDMYMANYPGSFVFNWIFMNVLGVDLPTYGRLIFPTLISASIVILIYVFGSRMFGRKTAFFSTFLAVLALYYVENHVSPNAVGIVLVLTSLCLIQMGDPKGLMLSLLPISFLIITHPESPLILAVFLVAGVFSRKLVGIRDRYENSFVSFLLFIAVLWIGWALFKAITTLGTLTAAISHVVNFALGLNLNENLLPSNTLYPLFGALRSYLLYSYAALAFALAFWCIKIEGITRFRQMLRSLGTKMFLIVCSVLLFFLTYLLRTTVVGGINLAQRGIFYLTICLSLLIASPLIKMIERSSHRRRLVIAVTIALWVAVNGFIYPLASYYAAAGGSILRSEGAGIEFLTHINIDSNAIFTFIPNEFTVVSRSPTISFFAWQGAHNNFGGCVDIAIFQRVEYFYFANQDLSFSNNSYTQSYSAIQALVMNRIYSNPTYEVFTRPSSCGYG